ncbi:MAG: intracellular protease, PfpI family [Fibrobacteres bacterium]|nr:intracellular protease, PfpI family [Fibrobacterota bacterium]
MRNRLQSLRIAVLATDGVEESEFGEPVAAFKEEGAEVSLVSPKPGSIAAWKNGNWSRSISVDIRLEKADASDFDALILPGGVINPDRLRMIPAAVEFVKAFQEEGKCIAAICHGPWLLAEADLVRGRTVTSWPSLKTDLRNAGANWVDQAVVEDGNIITSRKPDDIPMFNARVTEALERSLAGKT